MYISGNQSDFQSRLHSLPTGMNDMVQFKTEVSGYWTSTDLNQQIKWQKEAQMNVFMISGENSQALLQSFF